MYIYLCRHIYICIHPANVYIHIYMYIQRGRETHSSHCIRKIILDGVILQKLHMCTVDCLLNITIRKPNNAAAVEGPGRRLAD